MLRRTTVSLPPLRRAAALFIALALAKLMLAILRASDGVPLMGSALTPVVMVYQDAWVVLALLLADNGLARLTGGRPALQRALGTVFWVGAALLVLWSALNVPVARVLSTPLTTASLAAAGGRLADSILGYVTLANVVGALAPIGAFIASSRFVRPVRLPIAVYALAATSVIGPLALSSAKTLGAHQNAALALLSSALPSATPEAAPEVDKDLDDAGAALDLRDLAGTARGKSVIVVALESTRARDLAPWRPADASDTRDPMPNLTRLVSRGVIFERIWTAYPESIKGLWAAQCSQYPLPDTRADAHAQRLHRASCLAAILRTQGYTTGLFHSGWFDYFGMASIIADRGFDVMHDAGDIGGPFKTSFGTDDRATVKNLLQWLDAQPKGKPFYAVYLPIAGHHPYHAPGDAPRPFPEVSEHDSYLDDLAMSDAALGELMAGVADRQLADDVVWVVYGDHGEAFREHPGNIAHTLFLYEENLHVPLAIVLPPTPASHARRAPQRGSLVDLAPTVMDLLGLGHDPLHVGHSLLEPRSRPVVAFTDQRAPQLALAHGDWKAILDSGELELYDLASDPAERKDLASIERAQADRYRRFLEAWQADHTRAFKALDLP